MGTANLPRDYRTEHSAAMVCKQAAPVACIHLPLSLDADVCIFTNEALAARLGYLRNLDSSKASGPGSTAEAPLACGLAHKSGWRRVGVVNRAVEIALGLDDLLATPPPAAVHTCHSCHWHCTEQDRERCSKELLSALASSGVPIFHLYLSHRMHGAENKCARDSMHGALRPFICARPKPRTSRPT